MWLHGIKVPTAWSKMVPSLLSHILRISDYILNRMSTKANVSSLQLVPWKPRSPGGSVWHNFDLTWHTSAFCTGNRQYDIQCFLHRKQAIWYTPQTYTFATHMYLQQTYIVFLRTLEIFQWIHTTQLYMFVYNYGKHKNTVDWKWVLVVQCTLYA